MLWPRQILFAEVPDAVYLVERVFWGLRSSSRVHLVFVGVVLVRLLSILALIGFTVIWFRSFWPLFGLTFIYALRCGLARSLPVHLVFYGYRYVQLRIFHLAFIVALSPLLSVHVGVLYLYVHLLSFTGRSLLLSLTFRSFWRSLAVRSSPFVHLEFIVALLFTFRSFWRSVALH